MLLCNEAVNVACAECEGVLDQLLAEKARHLPVIECLRVLVQLRKDSAKLKMTLA